MNKTTENNVQNALNVIRFQAAKMPKFQENLIKNHSKSWIKCGEEDEFPDYLIELYQRSSKHAAIINGKHDYILGNGWHYKAGSETNSEKEAIEFIHQPNAEENLQELTAKVALDLLIFNGFALEIQFNRKGKKEIRHIPFHCLRTNAALDTFYYTRNWKCFRPYQNKDFVELNAFHPNTIQERSVFYYQAYTPKKSEFPVYPIPEYYAAIPFIEIDYEIANFHLNNIRNSFWGSFLINMYNGIPDEEQQDLIEKKIRKKFSGTDNAGRFILNFSDGKERGADLLALTPTDLDRMFDQLNKTVQQEIFIAHKVTSPMLFGVRTAGQLGGRSELLEAFELFKNTYILNKQKQLEQVFNFLFCGDRFSDALHLMTKPPVMLEIPLSDQLINEVLSKEELRSIISQRYNLKLEK